MDEQEYLYHYTSVDSLALILKNRTIRLNPLDKMDDLQEQKTSDIQNFGKFFFVSSWTNDETESIPMWKMYTDTKSGVRIKLRKNPFKRVSTTGADFIKTLGYVPTDEGTVSFTQDTFLNLAELMSLGVYCPQAWNGDIIHEIIYTTDKKLLEPQVIEINDKGTSISYEKLGRYKNEHWRFQKEWRYLMSFMPMDFRLSPEEMYKKFTETAKKIIAGTATLPISYYDLPIDDCCFEEMEITPSPQMNAGYRVLLEDLVEKYNPRAVIKESELKNLL